MRWYFNPEVLNNFGKHRNKVKDLPETYLMVFMYVINNNIDAFVINYELNVPYFYLTRQLFYLNEIENYQYTTKTRKIECRSISIKAIV